MHTRETVLRTIDGYLSATGMSERAFGLEVAKDHKFMKRLRGGESITLRLIERAERYMRENPAKEPTP